MDKSMELMRIAQGLRQASRHRDWRALQRLDRELNASLTGFAPSPVPGPLERQVLQTLLDCHAEARKCCSEEMDALQQTLAQMSEGRERWRAYAEQGGMLEERS